jgi:hypothetical protein
VLFSINVMHAFPTPEAPMSYVTLAAAAADATHARSLLSEGTLFPQSLQTSSHNQQTPALCDDVTSTETFFYDADASKVSSEAMLLIPKAH